MYRNTPSPTIRTAAIALVCVGGLSCGARTGYDNEVCQGAELLSTPMSGYDEILTAETCSFVTEQNGHEHRILCDGQTCRWYVDDVQLCTCQELDYANRCGNGVPMCADWLRYFDFSGP